MKSIYKVSVLLLLFYSCTRPNEGISKPVQTSYIAISGSDTAWLTLVTKGTTFKGKCLMNFNNRFTDSGDVQGRINGDTLIGNFRYKHYGLSWERKALALLIKEDKLVMGEGAQSVYLNIPYFEPPIRFDNVKFVFHKVNSVN